MKILVTGGASGLGASIVMKLAEDKSNILYFTYSSSEKEAKKLESIYSNSKAFHCNFINQKSVEVFISELKNLDIDVLINNANGKIHKEHFYKTEPDIFLKSFEENILPTIKITQESIRIFRKKKFGKIINIISSAIIGKPPIGWSSYVANKSYLLSLSNSWATENIKFNITSNCISPSFMKTNLTNSTDLRVVSLMEEEHPLKKLLSTEEVADTVSFLVNATQQINAINLLINAGSDI